MPFDGAGTYSPPGADFPVVTLTTISSTKFNNTVNDISTGISNCVTRDGQSPWTGNLPAGGFKVTGMAAGDTNGDSVRFEQVSTLFTTGDVKLTLKTSAETGWVVMNDTTIGNAASGGTGRANADTGPLFTLLWTNTADAQCAVSGGRGASAAADFAANKTIALPKALGRALAAAGSGAGLTARALALTAGAETHTLTQAETPVKSHVHTQQGTFSSGGQSAGHTHGITRSNSGASGTGANWANDFGNGTSVANNTDGASADHSHNTTISGNTTAASDATASAHNNMQPSLFLNVHIKL